MGTLLTADGAPASRVTHSFIDILRRGVEDAYLLVCSDSTGDMSAYLTDNTVPVRWNYQLMQLLAADWPAYTVVFCQWLDDTASSTAAASAPFSWAAPIVLQHGPSGALATHAVAGSSASAVITDASIAAGDAGKRVIGLNVPPHAYVGTVTAGASFTLVNEAGLPLAPLSAVTSIQLSADPLLVMWNAAVSGSRPLYGFGQLAQAMYGQVRPHLTLFNHGHNEVSGLTGPTGNAEQNRQNILCALEMLTEIAPAPVVMMGQNPRFDTQAADEPIRTRLVAEIAAQRGCGYVDVYSRFVANASWQTAWMFNSLHPNTAGYAEWADEAHRLFVVPRVQRLHPATVAKSLFSQPPAEQLCPSGLLLDWDPATGLPVGWSTNNATATKDTTTFGVTCLKIVTTVANGYVQSAPLDVGKVVGQWVTATIRVRYDMGSDPFQCGALAIHWVDPVLGAQKVQSNAPSTVVNSKHNGFGGWFYQSVCAFIPATATAVQVWMFGDLVGSSTASYVRRLVVQRGKYPAGDVPLATPSQFVTGSVVDKMVAAGAAVQPAKVSGLGAYLNTVIGAALAGTSGNYLSTPSAAANRITGDLEIGAKIGAGTSLRPSAQQVLIGKWGGTGKCYRLYITSTGALAFDWTADGTTTQGKTSSTTLAASLPSDLYVRVQLVASTGQVTFATSPDGTTWTQFGALPSPVGATSIFDSSGQIVEVGSMFQGTADNFAGVIQDAWLKSAIGGANAVHFAGASIAASWVADTGETWTMTGNVPVAYGLGKSALTAPDAATLAGSVPSTPRALLGGPSGALAVTYPRDAAASTNAQALPASGTVQVASLPVERGATVSSVSFRVGTTTGAGTAGNVHQWVALTDATGKVLAVTADQAATALASAVQTWTFIAPVTLAPGLYYLHLCIVMNTTMPTVLGRGVDTSNGIAPITAGPGATGQTTPPAVGSTLALPTANGSPLPYMWLT